MKVKAIALLSIVAAFQMPITDCRPLPMFSSEEDDIDSIYINNMKVWLNSFIFGKESDRIKTSKSKSKEVDKNRNSWHQAPKTKKDSEENDDFFGDSKESVEIEEQTVALAERAICNPLLHEGDILQTNDGSGSLSNFRLWKNAEIPYEIHDDLKEHETLIETAMRQIESETCVKFKPRNHESDYVELIQDNGCYSYVGKLPNGGKQPLSLGKGCHFIGTVVHELMHAVGFHHEHSREDRDKHVNILWDNVHPLAVNQFAIVDSSDYPQFYGFDFNSVMLYGSTAFSRDGRSPTVLRKKGAKELLTPVYHKSGMSSIDAKRVRKLYDC